jgi:hypothetical protein
MERRINNLEFGSEVGSLLSFRWLRDINDDSPAKRGGVLGA